MTDKTDNKETVQRFWDALAARDWDAMKALLDLEKAIAEAGPPKRTLDLVNLRASQINGCGYCVDMHARDR